MLHYPSQILKFGPLVQSWTMRHEAKLQVVKRSARHGNFKNINFVIQLLNEVSIYFVIINCGTPLLARSIELGKTINVKLKNYKLLYVILHYYM